MSKRIVFGVRPVSELVRVRPDDTVTVRYVREPLTEPIQPWETAVDASWDFFWAKGTEMGVQ